MNLSGIPAKFTIPFAASAGAGYIEAIPTPPASTPSKASFTTGFPPLTFQQEAAGGFPPWGADFNGLFYVMTEWDQWFQAGGAVLFDATFAGAVGGYPKGALVQASALSTVASFFVSLIDTNSVDPNSSPNSVDWAQFPEANVQIQKPNYALDTSSTQNQYVIAPSRQPLSFTEIIGAPFRFMAAATNSVNNPQINIGALGFVTMVNVDSTALGIGQIIADGAAITEGMIRADGKFQVNFPQKSLSGTGGGAIFPFAGATMPWFNETTPSGWLECAGQSLLIASYPALWAVLGTRYGGDGVTTFRMPDLRGEFIRGWDHGRGLDPGATTRTNAGGGLTGDHVGTNQAAAFLQHSHSLGTLAVTSYLVGFDASAPQPSYNGYTPDFNSAFPLQDLPWAGALGNATVGGDVETRPVNIYAMWIMFTG